MFTIKADFDDLLNIIEGLSLDQKRIIWQRLDYELSSHFRQESGDFHSGLSESETSIDIETALDDSRREIL